MDIKMMNDGFYIQYTDYHRLILNVFVTLVENETPANSSFPIFKVMCFGH